MSVTNFEIVLASSSPRRKDLLSTAGFTFRVAVPDVDETLVRGESSRKMVERLSTEKALACIDSAGSGRTLIIASDTTVVIGAKRAILGKPRDARDARRMLASISGRAHEVLTAFTVIDLRSVTRNGERGVSIDRMVTRTVSTKVRMRRMSPKEIAGYVATGEPLDKAGSYGAQGIGMTFVERIEGSYSNVVGLPMTELCGTLRDEFRVVPSWVSGGGRTAMSNSKARRA